MEFDFYTEYKAYADADLLQIVRHPGHYVPAAQEAAITLLNERGIDPFQPLEMADAVVPTQDYPPAGNAGDEESILESLLVTPPDKRKLEPWVTFMLVVAGMGYAWIIWRLARQHWFFLTCSSCHFYISYAFAPLILSARIAMWVLIWRRHGLGWKLLVADMASAVLFGLVDLYFYMFVYSFAQTQKVWIVLAPLLLRIALIAGLWQPQASTALGVKRGKRWHALVGGFAFAVAYFVWFSILDIIKVR